MGRTVTAKEAAKAFGQYGRSALVAPVTITNHGHPNLVLLSYAEYERLKMRDREVVALADFNDEDRAAVAAARTDPAATAFDDEVGSDA